MFQVLENPGSMELLPSCSGPQLSSPAAVMYIYQIKVPEVLFLTVMYFCCCARAGTLKLAATSRNKAIKVALAVRLRAFMELSFQGSGCVDCQIKI